MIRATLDDKEGIITQLVRSFDDNRSVNYIITQGANRSCCIKALMAYAFDMCYHYGEVFFSDDRKASALVLFPEKRKTDLRTVWLSIRLVIRSIGWKNVPKVKKREAVIKKTQPSTLLYYLWFIGVEPEHQGNGIGTLLLKEVIERAKQMNRVICLETSTLKNLPWYKKYGFEIYAKKDLEYPLYFLKQ